MLCKLRNRLACRKGKQISLGGRVTLLNSVLNLISLFYLSSKLQKLSFFKLLRFSKLFFGLTRKIEGRLTGFHGTICKSKADGGPRIQHCKSFNLALLSKWAWQILSDPNPIWFPFLVSKYDHINNLILNPAWKENSKKLSLWWRDIQASVGSWKYDSWWFCNIIVCKLGNSSDMDFWRHKWFGSSPRDTWCFLIVFTWCKSRHFVCRKREFGSTQFDIGIP